jgi:hypothetical protein
MLYSLKERKCLVQKKKCLLNTLQFSFSFKKYDSYKLFSSKQLYNITYKTPKIVLVGDILYLAKLIVHSFCDWGNFKALLIPFWKLCAIKTNFQSITPPPPIAHLEDEGRKILDERTKDKLTKGRDKWNNKRRRTEYRTKVWMQRDKRSLGIMQIKSVERFEGIWRRFDS